VRWWKQIAIIIFKLASAALKLTTHQPSVK